MENVGGGGGPRRGRSFSLRGENKMHVYVYEPHLSEHMGQRPFPLIIYRVRGVTDTMVVL